jgi:hypothetical protein
MAGKYKRSNSTGLLVKNRNLVPNEKLRAAYLKVAALVGSWREKFISDTKNIEAVKTELGPEYAHVPMDWIRHEITSRAKAPEKWGGGWSGTKNPARPGKDRALVREFGGPNQGWYAREYLTSDRWQHVRDEVMTRADGRCQICNEPANEVHHRCYTNVPKQEDCVVDVSGRSEIPLTCIDEEMADCIAICSSCHRDVHGKIFGKRLTR